MTVRKIVEVNGRHQLIIDLPENFYAAKKVTVTIDDEIDERRLKIEMMKEAASDPLFIADLKEINEDFDALDNELL